MDNKIYTVEIYTEEDGKKVCHISTENATGCNYEVSSPTNVGQALTNYIENFDDVDSVNLNTYSHRICDAFENLLDKFNIDIPDSDREGEDEEAHIFGSSYSILEDDVKEILIELANEIKRDNVDLELYTEED